MIRTFICLARPFFYLVNMANPRYVSRADFKPATDGAILRKQFICDEILPVRKADWEHDAPTRERRFVISTGAVDRDNDTIAPSGWKLDNYRRNPVVLFAHDYSSLPIARATYVGIEGDKLVAIAEFADHQMADTCLRLIDGHFLRATSVGFRAIACAPAIDRDDGYNFTEQELLEWSIVPVPANPEALIQAEASGIDTGALRTWAEGVIKGLSVTKIVVPGAGTDAPPLEIVDQVCPACSLSYDGEVCLHCGWRSPAAEPTDGSAIGIPMDGPTSVAAGVPLPINAQSSKKTRATVATKGVSPKDVSLKKASEDEAWSKPSLSDLTDKSWSDLSDSEKRKIAGHFAWAKAMPPDTFGDLSLPHHNAKGEVVWLGVAAAAARYSQASIPSADDGAVKAHLKKHYRQFSKELPEVLRDTAARSKADDGGVDDEAFEETAELVQYRTLAAMIDQVLGLLGAARGQVGDLILEEAEPSDQTIPGGEDDDGLEEARLESFQALCSQAVSGIVGAVRLAQAVLSEEADEGSGAMMASATNYDALVSRIVQQKRGRTISAANEGRLKTAKDHVASAVVHLDAVLAQVAVADIDDGNADEQLSGFVDVKVIDIIDDASADVVVGATPESVRAAIEAAIRGSVRGMVADFTTSTIDRMRGRVD